MIDLIELTHAVSGKYKFTPYRVAQLLSEADLDDNGKLDINEFARVMEAHGDTVDGWGMASKSIWSNFWYKLEEAQDIVEHVYAPIKRISSDHASPVLVGKKKHAEPSVALRIVAHILGPTLCFLPCILAFTPLLALTLYDRISFGYIGRYMNHHLLHFGFCTAVAIILFLKIFMTMLIRGQTPGHYVFGLQMVNKDGDHCGPRVLLLKILLYFILNAVTVGFINFFEGFFLLLDGRSLTDRMLDVKVVLRTNAN